MSMARNELQRALESLDLGSLYQRFSEENIDAEVVKSLSDQQLNNLGVATIGDRIRLRSNLGHVADDTRDGERRMEGQENVHVGTEDAPTSRVARELGTMFGPTRSRFTNRATRRSKTKPRTWTGKFQCLSEKSKTSIHTVDEKMLLLECGLGFRKIQFSCMDNEEEVRSVLNTHYPLLKTCGGYELLRCGTNLRSLKVLKGKWDVQTLKNVVGSQANIYIRPIQKNIDINIEPKEEKSIIKENCLVCGKEFDMIQLRNHAEECTTETVPHNMTVIGRENPVAEQGQSDSVGFSVPDHPFPSVQQQSNNETISIIELPFQNFPSVDDIIIQTIQPQTNNEGVQTGQAESEQQQSVNVAEEIRIDEIVTQCISYCASQEISEPISILRIYQSLLLTGRALDVDEVSETSGMVGETNFVMIDRQNVLRTAIDEVQYITDLRKCLEVQFYGEGAVDYGGPRKEFFRLVLQQIQQDYFDPVREWAKDYEAIGKIMALSMVQNGKLPRVMSAELVEEVFLSPTPRPFVQDLRRGLDSLGLMQLTNGSPTFIHLFTPCQPVPLTHKMLTQLLVPQFSPEGSNRRLRESLAYSSFLKYMREAASGRRGPVGLGCILQFSTGTDEEPVLGYRLQPSVCFAEKQTFLPTANTCVNKLILGIPFDEMPMPAEEQLFSLFDYAFSNSYFGLE